MRNRDKKLTVLMNGMLIGSLVKHVGNVLSFQYAESWLRQPQARPVSLSLPLTRQPYRGDVVYNFFDNLLPDNPRVRSRIQATFQLSTSQPFDLLTMIGKDCVGAIQLSVDINPFLTEMRVKFLTDGDIAAILKNVTLSPLGMSDADADFRISIAGAQEKSAFLFYQEKWCLPLATTATSHIVKLPMGFIDHQQVDLSDSCENEWLCSRVAKAFGLAAANAEIHHFDGVKALVVERFDRLWSKDNTWLLRLPQEDLCQALGYSSNLKYESDGGPGITDIIRLLKGSCNAVADQELFFRAQILFFLLAAIDGHAKNFSLFIQAQGAYCLTPLYDITSAHPLLAKKQLQKQKIRMAMALIGKNKHYHWHTIKRRHFISTAIASEFSPKKIELILEEMLANIDGVIDRVSSEIPRGFPAYIVESIFNGMRQAKKML